MTARTDEDVYAMFERLTQAVEHLTATIQQRMPPTTASCSCSDSPQSINDAASETQASNEQTKPGASTIIGCCSACLGELTCVNNIVRCPRCKATRTLSQALPLLKMESDLE